MGGSISCLFDKAIYVIDRGGNVQRRTQWPIYAGNVLIDCPDCSLLRTDHVRPKVITTRSIPPKQQLRRGEMYFLVCDEWMASPPSDEEIKAFIAKAKASRKIGCF